MVRDRPPYGGRGATAVMGFPLLDRLRAAGRQRGVCSS